MGEQRYFTVEEANSIIPTLEVHFGKVMQLRAQLRIGYERLEQLGQPPTADTLESSSADPEVVRARGRFRGLMEALTEALGAIEETGAQVKDLDIGLCDFLGQREGRDVWLCWQYGEKHIAFWHDLDTGFTSRQPIESRPPAERLLH